MLFNEESIFFVLPDLLDSGAQFAIFKVSPLLGEDLTLQYCGQLADSDTDSSALRLNRWSITP